MQVLATPGLELYKVHMSQPCRCYAGFNVLLWKG